MLNDEELKTYQFITQLAKRHGFIACVYGSSLLGKSHRDIDLMLVPWRKDSNAEAFLMELEMIRGYSLVGERYYGLMNSIAQVFEADDLLLDIQIRER